MKQWLENLLGKSWKTTLTSYVLAILIAIQPFLTEDVDLSNKYQFWKYVLRLTVAALIAIIGKQAADSSQVKEVSRDVKNSLYDLRNQGRQ